MAVPNEYALVVDVVGPRLKIVGDEEETRANSFWAVNDGCHEARKKDAHWGLLVKTGGAQVESRAADIWLYNLGNGTAQVVDVVGNAEGAPPPEGGARTAPVPSWGEKDIRGIDEWVEPYPRSDGGETAPDDSELASRVAALEEVVQTQGDEIDVLTQRVEAADEAIAYADKRITALEQQLAQGFHTHGPVDLPIVLESLTSLRARGDIDVAVKPGQAVPPEVSSDDGGLDPKKLWLWLKRRGDDEEESKSA